jgi:hypothetical protein
MKKVSVFRRRLRTARRFVFENIMDLDHVCNLHRRWFSDLRVRIRRPDYVEYEVTGTFHGLRQNMLARGGPVDDHRYWYEFLGRWLTVRVDGAMEGPDGDLFLIEEITYRFPWFAAPLEFLAEPLFRKQKEDILLADSRLLERVYRLDREGFRRLAEKP